MTYVSILGLIAASLTTAAFVPQALKTIKSKSAKDLSLGTFSLLFLGTIVWFIYGVLKQDTAIILANGLTASIAGVILYMKIASMKLRFVPSGNRKK